MEAKISRNLELAVTHRNEITLCSGRGSIVQRSLFDLAGQVAVVNGRTTGIGRSLALGLADANAYVVAFSRRAVQVEKVAKELAGRGSKTLQLTSNVLDRESIQAQCDVAIEKLGRRDILINCAGMIDRPAFDFPEETWNEIIEINRSKDPPRLSDLWHTHVGPRLWASWYRA